MSTYGWVIDNDHTFESGTTSPDLDDAGRMGPRDITPELMARLDNGEGLGFRMYDDDQELYYTGRVAFDDPDDYLNLPDEAFGPLHDFGAPNAGATEIRYPNPNNGKWEQL